jgi:hypothetical protein
MKATLQSSRGQGIWLLAALLLLLNACSKNSAPELAKPLTQGEKNAKLLVNNGDYWKISFTGYSNSATRIDTNLALGGHEKGLQYTYTPEGKYSVKNVGGGQSDLLESGTWKFSDDGKTLVLTVEFSADLSHPTQWILNIVSITSSSFDVLTKSDYELSKYDQQGNWIQSWKYQYLKETYVR